MTTDINFKIYMHMIEIHPVIYNDLQRLYLNVLSTHPILENLFLGSLQSLRNGSVLATNI